MAEQKQPVNMTDIPESKAKRNYCPLIRQNCVGSRCASCMITGIDTDDAGKEVENMVTCNNPNVNRSAEVAGFRKELMAHMKTYTDLFSEQYSIPNPKKKKAAKKQAAKKQAAKKK